MSDTAQNYQKLISDALQKQMVILGRQITLAKARHVPGLSINDDGQVTDMADDPQKVVIQFLEEFRELSSPLVKKTMQPLLNAVLPTAPPPTETVETETGMPKPLPNLEPQQEASHQPASQAPEQHMQNKPEHPAEQQERKEDEHEIKHEVNH
jgi:hypothetical protein